MRPQTAPSSRTDISRPAVRRSRLSPLFALGALALVLAGPVLAAEPDYIRPDQVDLIRILPPAPAPGSATTQDDFRILLDYQKARTPAQVAAANEDVKRHPRASPRPWERTCRNPRRPSPMRCWITPGSRPMRW